MQLRIIGARVGVLISLSKQAEYWMPLGDKNMNHIPDCDWPLSVASAIHMILSYGKSTVCKGLQQICIRVCELDTVCELGCP